MISKWIAVALIVLPWLAGCASSSVSRVQLVTPEDLAAAARCREALTPAVLPGPTKDSVVLVLEGDQLPEPDLHGRGFYLSDEAMALLRARARSTEVQLEESEKYREATCAYLEAVGPLIRANEEAVLAEARRERAERRLQAKLMVAEGVLGLVLILLAGAL